MCLASSDWIDRKTPGVTSSPLNAATSVRGTNKGFVYAVSVTTDSVIAHSIGSLT